MCVLKALGGLRGKLLEEHSGEWMPLDRLSQIADASPGSALEQTALAPLPGGLSASVASVLIACLERVERCESVGIPPAAVTPSPSSSPDPETDTPPEADAFPALSPWEGEALPVRSLHASQFLGLLQEHLAGLDSDAMELLACLRITVAASAGWSHRDLRQFFSAINYAIMCSERLVYHCPETFYAGLMFPLFFLCIPSDRCQLTTKMWIRELVYAAQ